MTSTPAMSEPLGTCKFSLEPHEKFVWHPCRGWKPLLPPSIGPATDKLNQQIRDVISGRKKIVVKKPNHVRSPQR